MKYKKFALIGMMGSGKSAVSKELNKITNIKLYEADDIFEFENNIKIKDFFKTQGEEKFRQIETEILKKILLNEEFIISTGGGVILSPENRKLLFNNDIKTIYLKTSPETIYQRIKNDKKRPLLMVENPKKEIETILNTREQFYLMADKTIETDNKTIEEITEEIIKSYE